MLVKDHEIFMTVIMLGVMVFLYHAFQIGRIQLRALSKFCDTGSAFDEWRLRNQGVYIGLSEEGRKLLGDYLDASYEYYELHPWVDGTDHIQQIVEHFYDFPPKEPDDAPSPEFRGTSQGALSLWFC